MENIILIDAYSQIFRCYYAMKATLSANASASLVEVLQNAASAAEEGAAKTEEYVAKFGRARNLGERSKGSRDAGATSLALIFRAFADAAQ